MIGIPFLAKSTAIPVMNKKLYLHIGTYKTGSTSIQQFSSDHSEYFRRQGIAFYRGQFDACNHV